MRSESWQGRREAYTLTEKDRQGTGNAEARDRQGVQSSLSRDNMLKLKYNIEMQERPQPGGYSEVWAPKAHENPPAPEEEVKIALTFILIMLKEPSTDFFTLMESSWVESEFEVKIIFENSKTPQRAK